MSKTPKRGQAAARPAGRTVRKRSSPASTAPKPGPAGGASLPRAPKGQRPAFHKDPAVDTLLAVIAALTAEVSVAMDRITTLERLLEQRALLPGDAIESYEPDSGEAKRRNDAREALIERVFRVLAQQNGGART